MKKVRQTDCVKVIVSSFRYLYKIVLSSVPLSPFLSFHRLIDRVYPSLSVQLSLLSYDFGCLHLKIIIFSLNLGKNKNKHADYMNIYEECVYNNGFCHSLSLSSCFYRNVHHVEAAHTHLLGGRGWPRCIHCAGGREFRSAHHPIANWAGHPQRYGMAHLLRAAGLRGRDI